MKRRKGTKLLALFAAAELFLTAGDILVMAETANKAEAVEPTGETGELPKNPVHNCTKKDDGTDTTTWSYVYFGSYPQTEVTGYALTAAITGAAYDANGDAWVNGTKYRRISKSDTNHDGYFGSGAYRYFKWERIKWRVLSVNGSTIFVMADKGLDCKNYYETSTAIITCTWENSTLRSWLNNDFYGTAFGSVEQGAVVEQTVVNEDNPLYNTEGGNDTRDKVYLLSFSEAMNPDYGFCEDYDTYSVSRGVKASDYAHARGAGVNTDTNYAGNCFWCLRSPGHRTDYAACVGAIGVVHISGSIANGLSDACVPALHINLSSDLWYVTDDGTSGEGGGSGTGGTGGSQNAGNNAGSGSGAGAGAAQENPKETAVTGKPKASKKAFTVKWSKQTDVSGYQIQYSTNKKFRKKGTKIKTVKKPSAVKVTIKKLKAGKKYYVRIRTYKTVNGKDYYSGWSKAKTVKVK